MSLRYLGKRRTLSLLFGLSCCLIIHARATARAVADSPSPGQGPKEVHVGVFVIDVDEVSSADQNFTASLYIQAHWQDPSLAHPGPDKMIRPLSEVWNPRLQFVNQQRLWLTFPEIVDISPSGEVTYRQRGWGSFSQPLQLKDFPFDRQQLNVLIVSAGYTPEEVKLIPLVTKTGGRSAIAEGFSLPDWKVLDWSCEVLLYRPIAEYRGTPAFKLSLNVARHSSYFVLKVILPLSLIVSMSWIPFWIDPKQVGINISSVITAVLTLVAYRFAIGDQLPKVAYNTRMDNFILISMLLVFASLLEVVVNSRLVAAGHLDLARRVDFWARFMYPICFLVIAVWTLTF